MSTTTDTIDLTNDGSEKINEVDNIHEDTPVEESAIDENSTELSCVEEKYTFVI